MLFLPSTEIVPGISQKEGSTIATIKKKKWFLSVETTLKFPAWHIRILLLLKKKAFELLHTTNVRKVVITEIGKVNYQFGVKICPFHLKEQHCRFSECNNKRQKTKDYSSNLQILQVI